MERIVEISCLEHIYNDKTKVEICGIEFVVNKGENVAVLGPNGGGKTTLIKHILGILTPSQGKVRVFGLDPRHNFEKIRQRLGVVLQSVEEQLIGPTVLEDIVFSPLNYGYSPDESIRLAEIIMDRLDISYLRNKVIHYLSGGEKRKVALAGALILNPELLIMDEPFASLDGASQKELISIINDISREKDMSVIVATHDIELVGEFADTMYLISSRKGISKKGTPREILKLVDELKDFNLEVPTIVKLFSELKKEGLDLGIPLNVEEAKEAVLSRLGKKLV
jgi:cobalt/nickel transport system ATP-binding protein